MGCASHLIGNVDAPLSADARARLGCRPGDRIDRSYVAEGSPPSAFEHAGRQYLTRAYQTTRNTVTAWWDASQIYGYDRLSRQRVKRDPQDPARLQMVASTSSPGGDHRGYLPLFATTDPINPQWSGQEATAFPDNWSVGLSFFHNLFAREHNAFVDAFRDEARRTPEADCGLRDPAQPDRLIRYQDVTPDQLFEVARLVVSAEIAKIHTTEWTPQLLYDEPMYRAANANWGGLLQDDNAVSAALAHVVADLAAKPGSERAAQWYSVLASGPGIVGLGSHVHRSALAATIGVTQLLSLDSTIGGVKIGAISYCFRSLPRPSCGA